jgi:regulator of replication initiation timing
MFNSCECKHVFTTMEKLERNLDDETDRHAATNAALNSALAEIRVLQAELTRLTERYQQEFLADEQTMNDLLDSIKRLMDKNLQLETDLNVCKKGLEDE